MFPTEEALLAALNLIESGEATKHGITFSAEQVSQVDETRQEQIRNQRDVINRLLKQLQKEGEESGAIAALQKEVDYHTVRQAVLTRIITDLRQGIDAIHQAVMADKSKAGSDLRRKLSVEWPEVWNALRRLKVVKDHTEDSR